MPSAWQWPWRVSTYACISACIYSTKCTRLPVWFPVAYITGITVLSSRQPLLWGLLSYMCSWISHILPLLLKMFASISHLHNSLQYILIGHRLLSLLLPHHLSPTPSIPPSITPRSHCSYDQLPFQLFIVLVLHSNYIVIAGFLYCIPKFEGLLYNRKYQGSSAI